MSFAFSDAAQLYAQNHPVVAAMESEYRKSINAFLDAVYVGVRQTLPMVKQKTASADARYWWLAVTADNDREYPQVGVVPKPSMITSGALRLFGVYGAGRDGDELIIQLGDIANRPEFRGFKKPAKGGNWSLFYLDIPYGDTDPVEAVVPLVVQLLAAMDDVHKHSIATKVAGTAQ